MAGFESKWESEMDFSELNRIMENVQDLSKTKVEVGYYGEDRHPDSNLSMGQLAYIHQFGVRSSQNGSIIPPRPFMTQAGLLFPSKVAKESRLAAINAIKGKVSLSNKYLQEIGTEGIEAIQQVLTAGNFKELKPVTIRLKRQANRSYPEKPLIASGALFEGSKYKITKK